MKPWQHYLVAAVSCCIAATALHYWHITATLGMSLMALAFGAVAVVAGWKAVTA